MGALLAEQPLQISGNTGAKTLLSWIDWVSSPVKPMLPTQAQIVMFWSREFIAFYNDSYSPTIVNKQPMRLAGPLANMDGTLRRSAVRFLAEPFQIQEFTAALPIRPPASRDKIGHAISRTRGDRCDPCHHQLSCRRGRNGRAYWRIRLDQQSPGRSENWPQSSENRCAHYADLAPAAFMGTAVVRSGDITKDPRYGHSAPHHGMPEEVGGRMSAISNFQFSQVGG